MPFASVMRQRHPGQAMTLEQNAYVLLGGTMQNREMTYVQISA